MSGPGFFYSPEDQDALTQIQRRQQYARALMQQGQEDPGHAAYSGLRNAGNSILGAFLANRADKAETGLAQSAGAKYTKDLGALLSGNQPAAAAPPPSTPPMPPPMASTQPSPQISNSAGSGPIMPNAGATSPQGAVGGQQMPAQAQATAPSPMPPQPAQPAQDPLQRLVATGNPALMAQFGPKLLEHQTELNDQKVTPISAQDAAAMGLRPGGLYGRNNATGNIVQIQASDLKSQGAIEQQQGEKVFENNLPMTPAQRAANQLQQAQLAETRNYHKQLTGNGLADDGTPNPVVDAWVNNIKSGNANLNNVPMGLRSTVSTRLSNQPVQAYTPLAGQRFTLESSRITHPYTNMAAYKLTADGLPYLQRIDAAMKTPGSVSDQDMLDSLTKLNTGGNAVTDAQVKLITDGKSYSDWAGTIGNKFKNGGVLSDNQRQQIKEIANHIYENYKKGYQPVYEEAVGKLKAAGVPEAFWTIPDLNKLNAGQEIGNIAHPGSKPAAAELPAGWSVTVK